jgi:pimeloyl-ACP methyl ester carboxylesterase
MGWLWRHHHKAELDGGNSEPSTWVSRDEGHETAVVFVHGVLGDLRSTFTADNGTFWPDLLKTDPLFKDVDIYTYGYRSEFFSKGLSIKQLARNMHVVLTANEILKKHQRFIFVCHSMGGLVTRAYLTAYADEVRDKLAFLYFFATPSTGSAIATIGRHLFPNTQLEQIARDTGDAFMRDLQSDWLAAGYGRTVASYCAYELKPYLGVALIVPWASASGLCNEGLISIEADHGRMVKPRNLNDKPHLALRAAFLQNIENKSLERTKLIPAKRIDLHYDEPLQLFSFSFKGVVKSVRGSGDAIQEVYATLYSPDGQSRIPFGDSDYECTKDGQEAKTPFLFAASEISCTFSQRLGALTRPALSTSGVHRIAITFETDDKRGHSVEYCFRLDPGDLKDLFEPSGLGLRIYHYAICGTSGGQ